MALSGDQRALLKLILERNQSYEDIAGLLGTDPDDVRRRARRAITELAGANLDRSAAVTDYLLGQADPIARADAVRHLSRDPDDLGRAEQAMLAMEAIAPNATFPSLPATRPAEPLRPDEKEPAERRVDLGKSLATPQRRLVALIGTIALAVIVAVIAIAGGGGGDGDAAVAEEVDPDFVRVELEPAAGARASGAAVIGQTEDDQPFIELDLQGLEPLGANSTYVLWMLTEDRRGIPVAPIEPTDGEFHDRMPLLSPADLVAAFSQSIAVSVMSSTELQESLEGLLSDFTDAEAEEAQLPVTRYDARTILRGEIPSLAELADGAGGEDEETTAPAEGEDGGEG